MKYELLKRTAIALFVGGIVSTYAMAEDKSVEDALTELGKAIKADATKQTEAVKSELTKKIEEQDKKINDNTTAIFGDDDDPENPGLLNTVDKHTDAIYGTEKDPDSGLINVVNKHSDAIAGVAANSYNNTLTLNGFKAGDDLYDIDPETGKVTKKTATDKDVKDDPLEGKGIVATVIKNKDSLDDLSEDLTETNAEVEAIGNAVKENRKLLDESNTAFGKLDESVSNLEDTINGDNGLFDKVVTHNSVIYGTKEDPDSGLINVVNKQTEAIAKLEARDTYNHLDKVEELIKDKAEKTDLKKVNADVENNTRSIKENKASIKAKAGKDYVDQELAKKANSAYVTAQLKQKVDQSTLDDYNKSLVTAISKKADQTDVDQELAKKANSADVTAQLKQKVDQSTLDDYNKSLVTAISKKADQTDVDKKANSSDVYTKDEANNRFVQIENNVGNNVTSISQNRANVTTNASNIARHNVRLNTIDSRVDKLDNRVNKLDKDLKRGLAAQAALTGLFQPYTVGKANFTAAVGGYKSQTAVAIGTGYRYNQNIATKAGVAFTQGGGVTYNAGVNFEW